MLLYRASLPLSRRTLAYTTGVVRRHRQAIGSKGRCLPPGVQALMTLVYLRKSETYAELGAGFGVSTTTAWRYVNETVDLLAARAPRLGSALAKAVKDGPPYLVLDGTLISIDRVAADRPYYSGKHRRHGMNLQVIAAPDGTLLWVSGPLRGSVHDLTAARIWGVIRALAATGLLVPADKAYQGAGPHILTPYKGRDKPESQKDANRAHAKLRGPGERANAQLKSCSSHGESCGSCAAAPTAPDASPKPSTPCNSARPHHTEKGSLSVDAGCLQIFLPGISALPFSLSIPIAGLSGVNAATALRQRPTSHGKARRFGYPAPPWPTSSQRGRVARELTVADGLEVDGEGERHGGGDAVMVDAGRDVLAGGVVQFVGIDGERGGGLVGLHAPVVPDLCLCVESGLRSPVLALGGW